MPEINEAVDSTDEADTASQGESQPAGGSRTLTSEEHDRIIKARIDKQNAKHVKEMEELKQKLAEEAAAREVATEEADKLKYQKQLSEWAEAVARENGIPAGIIRGATEEEMREHALQIKASVSMYPVVPSDKGDKAAPTPTKEGILAIEDTKERRAAIAANLELFT